MMPYKLQANTTADTNHRLRELFEKIERFRDDISWAKHSYRTLLNIEQQLVKPDYSEVEEQFTPLLALAELDFLGKVAGLSATARNDLGVVINTLFEEIEQPNFQHAIAQFINYFRIQSNPDVLDFARLSPIFAKALGAPCMILTSIKLILDAIKKDISETASESQKKKLDLLIEKLGETVILINDTVSATHPVTVQDLEKSFRLSQVSVRGTIGLCPRQWSPPEQPYKRYFFFNKQDIYNANSFLLDVKKIGFDVKEKFDYGDEITLKVDLRKSILTPKP